jgi:DNA invertase Pin-like site-specific DNA recombinase
MGRVGESYMSPAIQEADIRRWAKANGVTLCEPPVIEEDVSGGKAVKDRGLEKLIARIEQGQSDGVVVHHIDRFGRDHLDASIAIKRIKEAGGRFVATSTGTDSNDADSKMIINFYLMIAEAYLDRTKQQWDAVKRRNVEEKGMHVCAIPPFGYRRMDELDWPERPEDGRPVAKSEDEVVRAVWKNREQKDRNARLVVEPREAEVVRMVFKMRADGQPWANIRRAVERELGGMVQLNFPVRTTQNRVYLGEARAVVKEAPGSEMKIKVIKQGAHEAIVTEEQFDAVKHLGKKNHPLDGKLVQQALLAGVVKCSACGKKLALKGKSRKGERIAFYACANRRCDGRASANVEIVDGYVLWLLSQDESGASSAAGSSEQLWLEARELVRHREADLAELVADRGDVSVTVWRSMIVEAERDLGEARAAFYSLEDPKLDDTPTVFLGGKLWAYSPWGEDRDADRRTLHRYVGSVTLRSCGMNGRWTPIGERVGVAWADGSEPKIEAMPSRVKVAGCLERAVGSDLARRRGTLPSRRCQTMPSPCLQANGSTSASRSAG